MLRDALNPKTLHDIAYWVVKAELLSDCRFRVSPNCPLVSPRQAILWRALRKIKFIVSEFKPDGLLLLENRDMWSSQSGHRFVIPYGGKSTRTTVLPINSLVNYGGLASTQASVVAIYDLKGTSNVSTESLQAGR